MYIYFCAIHIFLDAPQLQGSLTAELHADYMIFFWPNITGIYSKILIYSCLSLYHNCETIFTTRRSPSHFVVRNPDENKMYFISIYQGNEEVFRSKFLPEGDGWHLYINKGLLAGLIGFVLVTCILVSGLTIYFCCRKARTNPKKDKKVYILFLVVL